MTEQKLDYLQCPAEYREVCEAIEDELESIAAWLSEINYSAPVMILAKFIDGKTRPSIEEREIIKLAIERIMFAANPLCVYDILPISFFNTQLGSFLMQAIWLLHDGEWLTVTDAQALTGKSQSGFSQWYKRSNIQPYLSPDGRLAFLRGDIEAAISEK